MRSWNYVLIQSIGIWLIAVCGLTACSDEKKPDGLIPKLSVYDAKDITRTSAVLSGRVVVADEVEISSCYFICLSATTGEQVAKIIVTPEEGWVEAVLDGLKANQTYLYYMEASNSLSKATSERQEFITLPNTRPEIGVLEIAGRGPVSVTVQCRLLDDGGLPGEIGFRILEKKSGAVQHLVGERLSGGLFKGKTISLTTESSFTVYAFASNAEGEVRSEELTFDTSNAIFVLTPGTMPEQLEGEMRYQLSHLTVAGKLNGADVRFIRDLLGRGPDGEVTPGQLKAIDLYDAEIVAGGINYMDSRYTVNHTLGTGMFKDCIYLEELVLPSTLEVIEKDALEGCISLASLQLPPTVTAFTPSAGCIALRGVDVASLNENFSSVDGVLYDKGGSCLLFYPEGREADHFTLPSIVRAIGEYAFRHAPVARVDIPCTVEELGAHAFHASLIEEVTLPGIVTIPYAAFQSCTHLQKVTLGASVQLLSDYSFDGCPLSDIYLEADYPPVCKATAFSPESVYQKVVVHVLPGCKSLYRLSNSWQVFQTFIEDVVISD